MLKVIKEKYKFIVAGIAFLAVIIGALIYLFSPDEVDVVTVSRMDISSEIDLLGVVEADEAITIYAPVSGRIKSIKAGVNDSIKEGQLLAEFDTWQLEKDYEKAKLNTDYFEAGYNAALSDNNKNKSQAATAKANSEALKSHYVYVEENRDKLSIANNSKSIYIQQTMQGIEGAINNMQTSMELESARLSETSGVYNEASLKLLEAESALTSHQKLFKTYQDSYQKLIDEGKEDEAKEYLSAIQTQSEAVVEAQKQVEALKEKLLSSEQDRDNARSSVNSIKDNIMASRDALATLPVDVMDTDKYALYLELTRQLDIIEKEWQSAMSKQGAAEEKIVNDDAIKQQEDQSLIAKADEEKALSDLNQAKEGIKTKKAGTIIEKLVDEGAVVDAGTAIFKLQPQSGYKISVYVSRYDIGSVEKGQEAQITIGGVIHDGKVSFISPIATDDSTGKPRVKVEIQFKDKNVTPMQI